MRVGIFIRSGSKGLQIIDDEFVVYSCLLAIASSQGKQPYQPFIHAEKRAHLINIISLSPKEANDGIYSSFFAFLFSFLT